MMSLHFSIAANEVVRRAVVLELGRRLAFEFGNDALGKHFAQFDAPLVKRINVPDHALREDTVLVKRDEVAENFRKSTARPGSCSTDGFPFEDTVAAPASPPCPQILTSSGVLPKAKASAWAKTFAMRMSMVTSSGMRA